MEGVLGLIQARLGSKRLPRKMLLKLDQYSIIEWVIKRSIKSKKLDKLVLATTKLIEDDILCDIAKKLGIGFFRGSENNVLKRFACAADKFNYSSVVRICADNPFIDPLEIDRLIKFFEEEKTDYCFNHLNKLDSQYADGFGAEIFSNKVLQSISKKVINKEQKEHVTLYLWDNMNKYRISSLKAPKTLAYPKLRFDIDNQLDFLKIKSYVDMGISLNSSAGEIIKVALQ